MCGHCKAEDAVVCEECGALVAFAYQPEHRRLHPHPYEEWQAGQDACLMCRLPESAPVHAGGTEIDVQRREIARLRAIVTRIIDIPRLPELVGSPRTQTSLAYTRGWAAVVDRIDDALLVGGGQPNASHQG